MRPGRLIVRWRYAVVTVVLGVSSLAMYRTGPTDGDWFLFHLAGRILTGTLPAQFHHVFAHPLGIYVEMPNLQIGPPAFVAAMPLGPLPPTPARIVAAVVMALALLPLLALMEGTARTLGRDVERVRVTVLVGGILLAPAWSILAVRYMHLDDLLAVLLLVLAVRELARDRGITAALALGTAAAAKPWAVAFCAILLVLPRARRPPAVLVAAGTALLWWLPFVIAAPRTVSALGSVTTPVAPDSTLALFAHAQPGWLRMAQLLLMIVVALLVARSGRWLLAPLAAVAVRVALDWQTWPYYGTSLVVVALLADVTSGRRVPRTTALALVAAIGPFYLARISGPGAALARLALLTVLAVDAWRSRARASEPERSARTSTHDSAGAEVGSTAR